METDPDWDSQTHEVVRDGKCRAGVNTAECGESADCIRFEGLNEGKCIDDKCEDGRWGAMCNDNNDCISPAGLPNRKGGVCLRCKHATFPMTEDRNPLGEDDCFPTMTKHERKYLADHCDPMVESKKLDEGFMKEILAHANCYGITYEPSNSRYTGRVGTQLLDSPKEYSFIFNDREGWTPVRSRVEISFWTPFKEVRFCNSGLNGAECGSDASNCVSGSCEKNLCVGNGQSPPPPSPPPPFPPPLRAEVATLDCASATLTMPKCSVSAFAPLLLVPIANRIETDVTGVGSYSGKCTCPNGDWYWAGTEDACTHLACYKFDGAEVTSTDQLTRYAEGADNALCLPPSDYTDGPGADHADKDSSGSQSGARRRITCVDDTSQVALKKCHAPGATILSTSWCPLGTVSQPQSGAPGDESGARPVCQEYEGTVWAMCDGQPYESWGFGPEGIVQAIRNCDYAYSNSAGNRYGSFCPGPDNYKCVAAADGTVCLDPTYKKCAVAHTCTGYYEELKTCPQGTWSCLAFNADASSAAAKPVLNHSAYYGLPDLVGGEELPQCWYPMMSPLGLGLRSSPAEVSSSIVPAAEDDLFAQCAHPPLLFPHKGTQDPHSPEDPGLGPPSSYTCDAGDELTRKYIYYEPTHDAIPRWDAICGETFWSMHAAKYKWSALLVNGAVSGCVGRVCRTKAGQCGSCNVADGCTLDLNLYATDLVYSSQVRVANIFEAFGKGSPLEQVLEAKRQLGYMVDGLDAYKTMTAPDLAADTYSSAGLVDTQIATIKGVSNALGVWAQGILQGNSSGFVPSFNLDFYQQQLGLYFADFKSLLKEMKTVKTLSEINTLIKESHAIDASAEESTTKVSMEQTIDTIESAASGMSSTLVDMKRLNGTIVQAGVDFQDALDKYYAQKRRQAIWKLAFSVANLCAGGTETAANMFTSKDGAASKKKGAEGWSSVGKFVGTFGDKARKMQKAATAVEKANDKDDADDKFPSSDAVSLTKELSEALADNDVPIPDDIPDGHEMAVLQDALDNLNAAYSSL